MPTFSTRDLAALNRTGFTQQKVGMGDLIAQLFDVNEMGICLVGTLGDDSGPATDGVYGGVLTQTAMASVFRDIAGVFTDYTTEAAEATPNDVVPWDSPPSVDDNFYMGHTAQFCAILMNITTAYVAGAGLTMGYQYWNGTAWTTLPAALAHDYSSVTLDAATGWDTLHFVPPVDWTPTTINSVQRYWIRAHCSAFTGITTEPLIGQIFCQPLTSTVGLRCPRNMIVENVRWNAAVISATNNDSVFVLINATQGTSTYFTVTQAVAAGRAALSAALEFDAGDLVILKQVVEDATTEFAGLDLQLEGYMTRT